MKSKHLSLFVICMILFFSCDLFNSGGTGTLIFQGVSELPGLLKNNPIPEETVTDVDGNEYRTITVGGKVWMAENLKVTHYANGDEIENETDSIAWSEQTSGAYCSYNNDINHVDQYGLLYNWHTINDERDIAPEGWHVATDEDWKHLEMALGMNQVDANLTGWRGTDEGKKLKSTHDWDSHDGGDGNGTDEFGFTAFPSGYRLGGGFYNLHIDVSFWTSTEYDSDSSGAWFRDIYNNRDNIRRGAYYKEVGMSIRCVKDDNDGDDGVQIQTTGAAFNIHEMWVSQSLVQEGVADNFEWHLIGEDQGLILMRDVEMIAEELPEGNYKSLKMVLRNQFVRHGRFVCDTSRTIGFESGIASDIADSSFLVNYFSSGGSYEYDDGAFVLMSSGENMSSFDINADRITRIYWKVGGPETKWSDLLFDWHDYDGDGLWTPGIDLLDNWQEPEDIPMWTFMVVEE